MRPVLIFAAVCLGLQAQIPAEDSRNINVPLTDTHFKPKTYKTLAEWQARRECFANKYSQQPV